MGFHDYWLHSITVFMGFFATMNPLGNIPVFLGMVKDFDVPTQNRVAIRSVMAAFIIISVQMLINGIEGTIVLFNKS